MKELHVQELKQVSGGYLIPTWPFIGWVLIR